MVVRDRKIIEAFAQWAIGGCAQSARNNKLATQFAAYLFHNLGTGTYFNSPILLYGY